jgi:hypothetical protein
MPANPATAASSSAKTTYAYWPGNAPTGTYEVGVWLQNRCTDTSTIPTFALQVVVNGNAIISLRERPDPNGLHLLTTFSLNAQGNATAGSKGLVRESLTVEQIDTIIKPLITPDTQRLTFGVPVNGRIDSAKPLDVYTFEARTGDNVIISLRQTGGNLDTKLFLLSPTFQQLAVNDDVDVGSDTNSQIRFQARADGQYIVVATRYAAELGGTTGTYELTIAQGR